MIVDVAVDQGGCIATGHPTSHSQPTYKQHGVIHYGVPNMPALVPVTGTLALSQVTFPYILELMNRGLEGCLKKYPEMQGAINCFEGEIKHSGLEGIVK